MRLQSIKDAYPRKDFAIVEGFDKAVIGLDESSMRICYSMTGCIYILTAKGIQYDTAVQYFEVVVSGNRTDVIFINDTL